MCKSRYLTWHMQRSPVQHNTEDPRTLKVEKMKHVEKGWGRGQLFSAKDLCHFNVHCLSPSLEVYNLWIHVSFTFGGRALCSFAGWKLRSPITCSCAGCFWMEVSGSSGSSLVLVSQDFAGIRMSCWHSRWTRWGEGEEDEAAQEVSWVARPYLIVGVYLQHPGVNLGGDRQPVYLAIQSRFQNFTRPGR